MDSPVGFRDRQYGCFRDNSGYGILFMCSIGEFIWQQVAEKFQKTITNIWT
jgi:hypothetical protein